MQDLTRYRVRYLLRLRGFQNLSFSFTGPVPELSVWLVLVYVEYKIIFKKLKNKDTLSKKHTFNISTLYERIEK